MVNVILKMFSIYSVKITGELNQILNLLYKYHFFALRIRNNIIEGPL